MVDQVEVRTADHKYGHDMNGFPDDTVVTWYIPEIFGDWRPTSGTLWELMQIVYSFDIYLAGYRDGEYVRLMKVSDTEYDDPPYHPQVWEVFLDNGKSFICCEDHRAMLQNHKDSHQALFIDGYSGFNDTSVMRKKRVKLTPKFKARMWMNLITKDNQPYCGPGDIIHCPAMPVPEV